MKNLTLIALAFFASGINAAQTEVAKSFTSPVFKTEEKPCFGEPRTCLSKIRNVKEAQAREYSPKCLQAVRELSRQIDGNLSLLNQNGSIEVHGKLVFTGKESLSAASSRFPTRPYTAHTCVMTISAVEDGARIKRSVFAKKYNWKVFKRECAQLKQTVASQSTPFYVEHDEQRRWLARHRTWAKDISCIITNYELY